MPTMLNSTNATMHTSKVQHTGVLSYQGMMTLRKRGLGSKRINTRVLYVKRSSSKSYHDKEGEASHDSINENTTNTLRHRLEHLFINHFHGSMYDETGTFKNRWA
jgi:recombinational DNA repair protein RecT